MALQSRERRLSWCCCCAAAAIVVVIVVVERWLEFIVVGGIHHYRIMQNRQTWEKWENNRKLAFFQPKTKVKRKFKFFFFNKYIIAPFRIQKLALIIWFSKFSFVSRHMRMKTKNKTQPKYADTKSVSKPLNVATTNRYLINSIYFNN